jgi:hypothetical protein
MKKIKQIRGNVICELTDKEMINRNMTSKFVIITLDEMQYISYMRDIEWEATSIVECEQWILGDDYQGIQAHELLNAIKMLYENNHCEKWNQLSEYEQTKYYNANVWRFQYNSKKIKNKQSIA